MFKVIPESHEILFCFILNSRVICKAMSLPFNVILHLAWILILSLQKVEQILNKEMPKLGIWEKNRARKNRKGSIHFARGKTLIEREKIFEPKVSTKYRLFLRLERIFSRHTQSHHFHTVIQMTSMWAKGKSFKYSTIYKFLVYWDIYEPHYLARVRYVREFSLFPVDLRYPH